MNKWLWTVILKSIELTLAYRSGTFPDLHSSGLFFSNSNSYCWKRRNSGNHVKSNIQHSSNVYIFYTRTHTHTIYCWLTRFRSSSTGFCPLFWDFHISCLKWRNLPLWAYFAQLRSRICMYVYIYIYIYIHI